MRSPRHTPRLTLRWPKASDAKALAAWINDWDVARQTGTVPHPYTAEHAASWIAGAPAARAAGEDYVYAVTRDGAVIGTVGLARRPSGDIAIGYMLARAAWGHGYMSEAVGAVMDEARDTLALTRCVADVYTDNPASAAVLRKAGFQWTGTDKSYSVARGETAKTDVFVWIAAQ